MKKSRQAFTLIELLAVIGIIIGLASLVFPIIGKAQESNRRTQAANNLRQICLAYNLYTHEHQQNIKADSAQNWAIQLAKKGGLNDAELYYIKDDPALTNDTALPRTILMGTEISPKSAINSEFEAIPLGYTLVANMPTTIHASTVPIAWTRGLKPDGTWSEDSPYRGQGGHIGYLDGHVCWYSQLQGDDERGALQNYQTGYSTANIREALPSQAQICY